MWFYRAKIDGDAMTREMRSLWDRKYDFSINMAMSSKEGSLRKEWFGDIPPKYPDVVVRATDDGYTLFLPNF